MLLCCISECMWAVILLHINGNSSHQNHLSIISYHSLTLFISMIFKRSSNLSRAHLMYSLHCYGEGHEINTLWNIKFRSSSHLRYINHHWDIISFHTHRLRAYWYKRLKLPWNFTRLVHWLVPWYHRNLFDVYYRNILRRSSSTIWYSCTQSHKYETCLCLCLKREHLEASWHRTNSRIDRACQAFQRLMLLDLRQATQDCFLALILKSALPASIWTCVTNTNLNSWAEKVSHR